MDRNRQVIPKVINSQPRRVMASGGSLYVGIPKGMAARMGIVKGTVIGVREVENDVFHCRVIWKGQDYG